MLFTTMPPLYVVIPIIAIFTISGGAFGLGVGLAFVHAGRMVRRAYVRIRS